MAVVISNYWKLKDSLETLVTVCFFFSLPLELAWAQTSKLSLPSGGAIHDDGRLYSTFTQSDSSSGGWMLSGLREVQPSSSSATGVQISLLPASFICCHGVQRKKPCAPHFPSHFPSITLEKLKSQVGELSEKNGLRTWAMGMTMFGNRI